MRKGETLSCRSSPFGYIHYSTLIITIRSERRNCHAATLWISPHYAPRPKRFVPPLALSTAPPYYQLRRRKMCRIFMASNRGPAAAERRDTCFLHPLLASQPCLSRRHPSGNRYRGSSSAFKPVALVACVWSGRLGRAKPQSAEPAGRSSCRYREAGSSYSSKQVMSGRASIIILA